jgi:hypothetical protein
MIILGVFSLILAPHSHDYNNHLLSTNNFSQTISDQHFHQIIIPICTRFPSHHSINFLPLMASMTQQLMTKPFKISSYLIIFFFPSGKLLWLLVSINITNDEVRRQAYMRLTKAHTIHYSLCLTQTLFTHTHFIPSIFANLNIEGSHTVLSQGI